jgi:hypothetical protein
MLRTVFLAVAVLALSAPAANAWTTVDGVSDPQTAKLYRDWQAQAQIPTPHVTVNIIESTEPCDGAVACLLRFTPGRMTLAFADPRWLWNEDGPTRERDRLMVRALFYHELTHVRDYQPRKTHRYRDRFAQIMRWRPLSSLTPRELAQHEEATLPGVYEGWGVCITTATGCIDPGETFAQAGAWCSLNARNRTLDEWAAGYGYAPTLAQHRAACRLLGRLS